MQYSYHNHIQQLSHHSFFHPHKKTQSSITDGHYYDSLSSSVSKSFYRGAPREVHTQALLCNLSSLDVYWLIQGDLRLSPVASNTIPNMARIVPGTMFAQ